MKNIKQNFPIFSQHENLVYLDNAASTQTPQVVLDAMNDYYTKYRANIHRGLYDLSAEVTEKYEEAREKVAKFIGAEKNEIIFTSGTTHGLNFLARSLCKDLKPGDNIVLTRLEHHANLIPWQQSARERGAELRFIELQKNNSFEIDLESAKNVIDKNTKIVSFALVSNALGTFTPAKEIIEMAKEVNACTVIDAAQAMAHIPVNVKNLDCDFLVFSGHKMYGPTGIGVLYGKRERLDTLEPFFYGGDMVTEVSFESATWAGIPERFEGGTPNIAGALGLGAAVDFIDSIGFGEIQLHEQKLVAYFFEKASDIQIIGPKKLENRIGVISFLVNGVHPHDIAEILNREKIAIRAGHHCCMPLMKQLHLAGTARVSMGIYNTEEDIEKLIEGIKKVQEIFHF